MVFNDFFQGHIYQVLTYFLVSDGLLSVLFECLLIWFLGCELESLWGERFYLKFMATCLATEAVVFLLISLFSSTSIPLIGISGFAYGLIVAYGILYSDRQMLFMLIFPMKAKWFCALLGGILLYTGIFSPYAKASWAHLAAMVGAFAFLRYQAYLKQNGGRFRISRKKNPNKVHLYVIKDEDDENGPTFH